jgi:prevent-host-death family protein
MDKIISVAEARQNLADVLGEVAFGKQTFLITKKGKPVARIVPIEGREGAPPRSLGEISGWLDANDPFFENLRRARKSAGQASSPFKRRSRN